MPIKEILVFANASEDRSYIAEEQDSRRLTVLPSVEALGISMADHCRFLQALGMEEAKLIFKPIDPEYKIIKGPPGTRPRELTEDEHSIFMEWFEAKKQFFNLKDKYGFH